LLADDPGDEKVARIRYLAMHCSDPAALAGFYVTRFGLRELGRSPDGDVTLTDGGFNVTLFRPRAALRELNNEIGLHHIGIAVDDMAATLARYRAFDPRGTVLPEPGGLQFGEMRIHDPECHPVSLSARDFGLPAGEPGVPRIAHLALNALDTERMRDFFTKVFGLREVFAAHAESRKRPGYRNKHVGDGHSNVAIQAFYNDDEGHEARFGIAHFGLLVPDSKLAAEAARQGGATFKARPAVRTQSEIRMRDPDRNGCDLSQRGWEVDTDKWVRASAA
jgi:catechol 2,3-dioxygenase-like lactoylglutathione lyase family enzyme